MHTYNMPNRLRLCTHTIFLMEHRVCGEVSSLLGTAVQDDMCVMNGLILWDLRRVLSAILLLMHVLCTI